MGRAEQGGDKLQGSYKERLVSNLLLERHRKLV